MTKIYKSIACKILFIFFLWVDTAHAQLLEGKVIGIIDGDTIRILDADKRRIKVRLAGIDAPEKGQPYGTASKQSLSSLVYQQHVSIDWEHERYSYDRIVGKVLWQGQDINLAQVRQGMAWHYKQFASEQSVAERASYAETENRAKAGKLGLWQDAEPVPPWTWRRKREDMKKTQEAFHEQWRSRHWQFR